MILAAWVIAELGLTTSDGLDFANTLNDPNANLCDKAWSGALFAAGLIGPGGGYGKGANIVQKVLKQESTFWKSLNNFRREIKTGFEDGKKVFYTWDDLHGEVEVFDSLGKHIGVKDSIGNWIKPAVNGRKIDL